MNLQKRLDKYRKNKERINNIKPYEEDKCSHPAKLKIDGDMFCQVCGKIYNETTLDWE